MTLDAGDVHNLTLWLLQIAHQAESIEAWDLLEDTVDAIFYLNSDWTLWEVHEDIHAWLSGRSGAAAAIAAQALRAHPHSIPVFRDLAQQEVVDHRIRQAITRASQHASDYVSRPARQGPSGEVVGRVVHDGGPASTRASSSS